MDEGITSLETGVVPSEKMPGLNRSTPKVLGLKVKEGEGKSAFQELAVANGRFYESLVDICLSNGSEKVKQARLDEALNGIPDHARGLYVKGLKVFQSELSYNHASLDKYKGNEISHLISVALEAKGWNENTIKYFLKEHVKAGQAFLTEPTPGIIIVHPNLRLDFQLVQYHVMSGRGKYIGFDDREEPSFLIMPQGNDYKGNPHLNHESHHLIWHFLERSGFVRSPKDTSPELEETFGAFRDEFAAYIVEGYQGENFRAEAKDSRYISRGLLQSSDETSLGLASDVISLAASSMERAQKMGIDSNAFLYPVMISRNFAELKANLLKLVPGNKELESKVD